MADEEPVLDHVVLGARSRDVIDRLLDGVGLTAGSSRVIPGVGMSNVVVPVGTQLLELVYADGNAVVDGAPPYARLLATALDARPGLDVVPVAWLVRVPTEDALRAAAARVGYPVIEVPPEPPNHAAHLLTGLGAGFDRPWLPTFIHWRSPPHLPPPITVTHRRLPAGPISLDVSAPAGEVEAWCGASPVWTSIGSGSDGPLRVRIPYPDGSEEILGVLS